MNKQSNRLLLLALLAVAAGCNDPKTREIERLRADLEASRADAARARAEADAARADLVQALADAQVARTGLARLKGEPVPAVAPPRAPASADADVPLEQRFAKLKASYDKSEIQSGEWAQLKTRIIENIPAYVPAADRRTLGQRLIDLKAAYDNSSIQSGDWTQVKAKLIAQKPAPGCPAPSLDKELADLKRAYDASAIHSGEWTQAKGEVIKWAE